MCWELANFQLLIHDLCYVYFISLFILSLTKTLGIFRVLSQGLRSEMRGRVGGGLIRGCGEASWGSI